MKAIKTILVIILLHSIILYGGVPSSGELLREYNGIKIGGEKFQKNILFSSIKPPKKGKGDKLRVYISKIKVLGVRAIKEEELRDIIKRYENRELSFYEIKYLSYEIMKYYREKGYIVSYAYIPEQKIRDKEIEIRVLEGKLEGVKITNETEVLSKVLKRRINNEFEIGKAINIKDIERMIEDIKELKGVDEVEITLMPGEEIGSSILRVKVKEQKSFNYTINLDNNGNRYSGRIKKGILVQSKAPFKRGGAINLYVLNTEGDLKYSKIEYETPGIGRVKIKTYYERIKYRVGKELYFWGINGKSYIKGITMNMELRKGINLYLRKELRGFRDSLDLIEQTTRKHQQVSEIGINYIKEDEARKQYFVIDYSYSDGRTNAIEGEGLSDIGTYKKENLMIEAGKYLRRNKMLNLKMEMQLSDKSLDSYEKMSLGGIDKLSGYSSGNISADEGIYVKLTYRIYMNGKTNIDIFEEKARIREINNEAKDELKEVGDIGIEINQSIKDGMELQLKYARKVNNYLKAIDGRNKVWFKLTYAF